MTEKRICLHQVFAEAEKRAGGVTITACGHREHGPHFCEEGDVYVATITRDRSNLFFEPELPENAGAYEEFTVSEE